MTVYTFEEKASLRRHMEELITSIEQSQSLEEMTENSVYAAGFLSSLPQDDVCTDEQAAEWGFQLQLAKDRAIRSFGNLV
ncbi:hypothetical protein [Pseudomonas sp.]|uniref:hypothetical protein n=1 Tax=Pseudomonas sp. TaxID=306 RepID=UPI0031B5F466